ncbi:MAG TPA: DEAD/DEAH box helicase [Pirellulales bacterium]|nr:DEAD/DEAH box helicase [Pirellulales bacterium]
MNFGAPFTSLIARGSSPGVFSTWSDWLAAIAAREAELTAITGQELRKRSLALRYRAKSGEPLDRLLPEAYAMVREAGRRTLNMRHFDVQLLGGIAMHRRSIVEMQTGEGKTLAATLPAYLNALRGRGAHIATVNDYLARRDAEWMRPIYETLGLQVGVIQGQMSQFERRQAYGCDVTYGTSGEFAFDYLRDRLLNRKAEEGRTDLLGAMLGVSQNGEKSEAPVHRALHFILVDEADSILIDDARTPLILSAAATAKEKAQAECYRWAAAVASRFDRRSHYVFDAEKKTVELTAAGRKFCRGLPKPAAMDAVGTFTAYEFVERAIKAELVMFREQHYVVRDDQIVIVDEYSGRLAEGRMWFDGTQQAIQAKEGLEIAVPTGQAARITVQDFFSRYDKLCGMTGTAINSARELRTIYEVRVRTIPTNRPAIRQHWPELIFGDGERKHAAIVAEVVQVQASGRPVLIGTRTIEKSQRLSDLLAAAGTEHQVLNAYHAAYEAEIIARAGERGQVTVSTNMAGRGTDIRLGPGVAEFGGLHVILSEMHEAARIDRQLIGRCGRQGDPGSYRQFLALDDDILLAGLGPQRALWLEEFGEKSPGPFEHLAWAFRKAQRIVERRHFTQRRALRNDERERRKMQRELGQDPCLDAPG